MKYNNCGKIRVGTRRFRNGMASVMAMMYLMLVAALAVGFYSAISTSGNIADNEQYVQHAQTTAEAAIAFGRYEVGGSSISVPYSDLYAFLSTSPSSASATIVTALATALGNNVSYTEFLGSGSSPATSSTGSAPVAFTPPSGYNAVSSYLVMP